MCQVAGDSDIK